MALVSILCRPSISDQQKVGFFRQDRAAQTQESEILELKQMTIVLQSVSPL